MSAPEFETTDTFDVETESRRDRDRTPRPTEPVTNVFTGLPAELIEALRLQGIVAPTPVQAAVIPDAMAGHDVLGRAQTGSGKTLAFGIPVLAKLAGSKSRPCHPRAVLIVPTRELANQVARAIQPLAASVGLKLATVYGGTPYEKQTRQLRQRADIVVATPGRLEDLLRERLLLLRRHRADRPRRGRPPVRPRLLPVGRQAGRADAGGQPADAAQRHPRR